jgi:hypothetical protein
LPQALPALHDAGHPDHVRVSYDLHRLLYKMFCASFEKPISEWCWENGLAYSGEKPSLRMAQLRYMDIPGCEPGHTKVGTKLDLLQAPLRGNAKATASAAYLYGKQGALCECYHSTGWSATLQDAKFIADGLLLMGIKYLVPHGFFYSTHGLRKHDAPPTFFFQMPFWPMFAKLAERVARLGSLFEGTHIDAEVLLVEPTSGVPTRRDLQTYAGIHWLLMESHLDYHVVDTDILEGSQIDGGCVCLGDVRAKAIIVPPMRVIEEPVQAWLARYKAAGGSVLYCRGEEDLEDLRGNLRSIVQPSLHVQVGDSEAGAVMTVKRAGAGKTLWFVLHTGDEAIEAELWSGGNLREVPLDKGLPALLERDGDRYRRTIRPLESFVVERVASSGIPAIPARIRVPVGGAMEVKPLGPNLLRMYDWRMTLLRDGEPYGDSAVVGAVPLANQLEQGGFRFAPAMEKRFGHPPELAFPELEVRYEYTFGCDYAGRVELVMEPGSIAGEWAIQVNQGAPIGPEDMSPTTTHVRGSLGIEVSEALKPGRNAIRVEVRTAGGDGGLLNPLYLAGDFGVALDPVRLVPRPSEGVFEGYEENLLPYYAGAIDYGSEFTLEEAPQGQQVLVEFDYEVPFYEAAEVSINGGQYQPVPWEPRVIALPDEALRVGTNTLRTRVYTTQIRAFEGQWFDYAAHRYRDVGEGPDAR